MRLAWGADEKAAAFFSIITSSNKAGQMKSNILCFGNMVAAIVKSVVYCYRLLSIVLGVGYRLCYCWFCRRPLEASPEARKENRYGLVQYVVYRELSVCVK